MDGALKKILNLKRILVSRLTLKHTLGVVWLSLTGQLVSG